jgi:hypothetical protein
MTTGIGSARTRLIVFDLQQWKLHAQLAHYTDADVYQFHWVGDERLVYSLADLQSSARPIWWPGLFSVQRDGSNQRQLVKIDSPFLSRKNDSRASHFRPRTNCCTCRSGRMKTSSWPSTPIPRRASPWARLPSA